MSKNVIRFNLSEIKVVPVDITKIKKFEREGQHMGVAVELLKEVLMINAMLAGTYHLDDSSSPRNWNRNEAILTGLLVRVSKLFHGYLDQVCQHRGEIAGIIFRPLIETLVNLKFLLEQEDDAMFDEYVEYSLREEKRFLNQIEKNVQDRGGEELPIETRMKRSIKRAFDKSGFTPEQVNEKKTKSWGGSIYQRAKKVGLQDAYTALLGLPSHATHGNWQDLITNHLNFEDDGSFTPDTDWSELRPQPLFATALIAVVIGLQYLDEVVPDYREKPEIRERFEDLRLRISVADELHEQFLQKRAKTAAK